MVIFVNLCASTNNNHKIIKSAKLSIHNHVPGKKKLTLGASHLQGWILFSSFKVHLRPVGQAGSLPVAHMFHLGIVYQPNDFPFFPFLVNGQM